MLIVKMGEIDIVNVSRWRGRNVLVHWWLFLVPGDAHSSALGEDEMELCAQNTGSSGRRGLVRLLQGSPFFGYDHFDDEVVLHLHAIRALHVADRLQCSIAGSTELGIDVALVKVGLPAMLHLLIGDDVNVLVENAFALTANLLRMLATGRRDELLSLLDAPIELSESPPGLRVVLVLNDAGKAHLDWEVANGVDDRGKGHGGGEIGRREDADGMLLVSREDGAFDFQIVLEYDFLAGGCGCHG